MIIDCEATQGLNPTYTTEVIDRSESNPGDAVIGGSIKINEI